MGIAFVQALQLFVLKLPFAPRRLALFQFILILTAFAALIWAFVTSDFSLALVAKHSHSSKPLLYKIAGVWGNHEGSMLLFVLIHSLLGAAFALKEASFPETLKARTLSLHAGLTVALVAYLLFASNPFEVLWLPPLNGEGMNPMLQDPSMAIHPPALYLGYVGFSMCFSFALALIGQKTMPPSWAEEMRFWTLLPWGFLTFGIMLGSWWAYYELGWGGWWAWDPVENASLMPWLLGTALLHSLTLARKKKRQYKNISLILALIPFMFSLFGTFVVRSGLINSVHAFAQDPGRGLILISFLCVVVVGAGIYTLKQLRYRENIQEDRPERNLKEKLLFINVVTLVISALLVMLGTALPTLIEKLEGPVFAFEAGFYLNSFVPLMALLLLFMPFGLRLGWTEKNPNYGRKFILPLVIMMTIAVFVASAYGDLDLRSIFGVGLALWIISGTCLYLLQDKSNLWQKRLPLFLAHFGLGVAILGMVVSSHWRLEATVLLKEKSRLEFAGYFITLEKLREVQGPNYLSLTADLKVEKGGMQVAELHPERRLYPVEQQTTYEIAIHTNFLSDLYVVLGAQDPLNRGWAAKLYFYPLIPFIWLGCLFMIFGAFWSLFILLFWGRKSGIVMKK